MKVNELEISNPNVTLEEVRKYIDVTIVDEYADQIDEEYNEIFYKYGWIEHMKNPKGDIDSFVKFLSQVQLNSFYRELKTYISGLKKINELEVNRPFSLIKGNWYIISNSSLKDVDGYKATFQERSKSFLSNSALFFLNDDPKLHYYIFGENLDSDHIKPISKPINELEVNIPKPKIRIYKSEHGFKNHYTILGDIGDELAVITRNLFKKDNGEYLYKAVLYKDEDFVMSIFKKYKIPFLHHAFDGFIIHPDNVYIVKGDLNEFQNKPILGTGVEHDIYPDNKNKDRIFKVPKDAVAKDEMYKWIKTFSKYPRIFAKIYRAKDNSYVSLEKLDTSRVQQEYRRLYDYFTTKHPLIDQETSSISSDPLIEMFLIMSLLDSTENKGKIRDIQKRMRQDDPSLLPIFNNWLKLTLIMRDVAERENLAIDFHIDNFGYDKEGNLKMLDI